MEKLLRVGEQLPERLLAVRLQIGVGIIPCRHLHNPHRQAFRHKLPIGFLGRCQSGLVRVITDEHVVRVTLEQPRVFPRASRAAGGDGVLDSQLVAANRVDLALA